MSIVFYTGGVPTRQELSCSLLDYGSSKIAFGELKLTEGIPNEKSDIVFYYNNSIAY